MQGLSKKAIEIYSQEFNPTRFLSNETFLGNNLLIKADTYFFTSELYRETQKRTMMGLYIIGVFLLYLTTGFFSLKDHSAFTLFFITQAQFGTLLAFLFFRFQNIELSRLILVKDQITFALVYYFEDQHTLQYIAACLVISNMIFVSCKWRQISEIKVFIRVIIFTLITLEELTISNQLLILNFSSFNQVVLQFQSPSLGVSFITVLLVAITLALHEQSNFTTSFFISEIERLRDVIHKKDLTSAAMIHELRQPLNAVIGAVDLLTKSKNLSVFDKQNLVIAKHSADILMNLIGNILDIAKSEANKIELDQQYVNLQNSLKNIMELVKLKAENKNIELKYYFAPEVPDYVNIDNQRFTQIVLNLISNAVKFTNEGFVRVLVNFIPDQLKESNTILNSPTKIIGKKLTLAGNRSSGLKSNAADGSGFELSHNHLNSADSRHQFKQLMKRNSAPDYINDYSPHEFINITSHDSENSSELKDLGKIFKKNYLKWSMPHISRQYLQDPMSLVCDQFNNDGTLDNLPSLGKDLTSQRSLSPVNRVLASQDGNDALRMQMQGQYPSQACYPQSQITLIPINNQYIQQQSQSPLLIRGQANFNPINSNQAESRQAVQKVARSQVSTPQQNQVYIPQPQLWQQTFQGLSNQNGQLQGERSGRIAASLGGSGSGSGSNTLNHHSLQALNLAGMIQAREIIGSNFPFNQFSLNQNFENAEASVKQMRMPFIDSLKKDSIHNGGDSALNRNSAEDSNQKPSRKMIISSGRFRLQKSLSQMDALRNCSCNPEGFIQNSSSPHTNHYLFTQVDCVYSRSKSQQLQSRQGSPLQQEEIEALDVAPDFGGQANARMNQLSLRNSRQAEENKQQILQQIEEEEKLCLELTTENFYDEGMNEGIPSVRFENLRAQESNIRGTLKQLSKPPQFSKPYIKVHQDHLNVPEDEEQEEEQIISQRRKPRTEIIIEEESKEGKQIIENEVEMNQFLRLYKEESSSKIHNLSLNQSLQSRHSRSVINNRAKTSSIMKIDQTHEVFQSDLNQQQQKTVSPSNQQDDQELELVFQNHNTSQIQSSHLIQSNNPANHLFLNGTQTYYSHGLQQNSQLQPLNHASSNTLLALPYSHVNSNLNIIHQVSNESGSNNNNNSAGRDLFMPSVVYVDQEESKSKLLQAQAQGIVSQDRLFRNSNEIEEIKLGSVDDNTYGQPNRHHSEQKVILRERDIRRQIQTHSDNYHQNKIKSTDPFRLSPDLIGRSSSHQRNQITNMPSLISDPKYFNNSKVQTGTLKIVIQDSGIGIDEEEQKKLFNPFSQANNSIQKKFGGTGLGLWITKKLITIMDGKIGMKSKPSMGTTFTFTIPIQGLIVGQSEGTGSSQQLPQLEANLSKLSVLILIQDEFHRDIFRKFLVKLQCNSFFTKDYDEFVQKLQFVHKFNVCIIDTDQFSLSQNEIIKQLVSYKKDIEHKTIKSLTMIILSNFDFDTRTRKKYLENRIIIYKKPVKQELIKNLLQEIQTKERALLPHLILREQNKMKSMKLRQSRKFQDLIPGHKFLSVNRLDNFNTQNPIARTLTRKDRLNSVQIGGAGMGGILNSGNNLSVSAGVGVGARSSGLRESNGFLSRGPQDAQLSIYTPNFNIKSYKGMSGEYDKSLFEDSIFLKGGSGMNLNINGSSKNNMVSVVANSLHNGVNGNVLPGQMSKKSSILSGEDLNSLQIGIKDKSRKISFQIQDRQQMLNSLPHSNQKNSSPSIINNSNLPGMGFFTINEESSLNYQKQETFNHKGILIVDDEGMILQYYQALLSTIDVVQQNQINVISKINGKQAYEYYISQPSSIQLIMMDLNMPVMGGLEAAALIKEFEDRNNIEPRVYIVCITGEQIDNRFRRSFQNSETRINQFLSKPFKSEDIENILIKIYNNEEQ